METLRRKKKERKVANKMVESSKKISGLEEDYKLET